MKTAFQFIIFIGFVIIVSFITSYNFLNEKSEKNNIPDEIIITDSMLIQEISIKNNISLSIIKKAFSIKDDSMLAHSFVSLNISRQNAVRQIKKYLVLEQEHRSKNWKKILTKFVLWIIFMLISFTLLRKNKMNIPVRNTMYFAGIIIFGVILGADPSPMGTIKDAIVLFGTERVLFPPRLVAFAIFILTVIIANKFICSWGCQFGLLQDFIFRLKSPKIKIPFVFSNSLRFLFFIFIIGFAFFSGLDIVENIDPFKIFKPQVVLISGWIFIGSVLVLSLFIYRPWCHFFCPFGLVGWLAEKISIFKIRVDYSKCIGCGKCEKACPTVVMSAILKQKKNIPDCFSCGVCIETCPFKALSYTAVKRCNKNLI